MADDGNTGQAVAERTVASMGGAPKPAYLEDLKKRYTKAKVARDRYIPDWYLNLAMFIGQQWMLWSGAGRLQKPILPNYRETLVDNRILPVVTARCARKVKSRPVFVATPSTEDEADIGAAKLGERVLDSDWRNLQLGQKLFQAVLFSDICGAGFWKIYWDSTKGEAVEFVFDQNGDPVIGPDGSPLRAEVFGGQLPEGLTTKLVAAGDVCVDVLSPFEIFPDPLASSLDTAEWVIEEKVRSPEYLKRRYGATMTPNADAPLGPVESRLFTSAFYSTSHGPQEGVKVYEMWARPSTEYPQGKRCVWAKEEILYEDDQPFDSMPYVMFSGVRVPSRFWPTSVTTQLRDPQVTLNKLISQIQENANRIGNPSLMSSRQANIEYNGVPGERVYYDSTVPDAIPSYLQPPEIPVYIREQVQRVSDSIAEISGIHEVSNATVPTGVTAASAINLLQEADDTRLGPEIQDMEAALAQAGTKLLKLRARYNTDERMLKIAGEDGNWDIFRFRGAMLRESTEVEVQAGSAMPRSKAAKQAAMMEVLQTAFQYGLNFDPRDLRQFFKDYEVGGLERLFGALGIDEAQVNRENRLMTQGQAVNINEYDDDEYHIAAHADYQKTERYSSLPDPVKQIINVHVNAHRERQVQQTNAQMQAQRAEQQAALQQQQQNQMGQIEAEHQFQLTREAAKPQGQR